jgi:hypothetical protein
MTPTTTPTFRTFRVTFQASGAEPQTATLRVFMHPEGLQVEDAIHLALDDEFGWGDIRRLVSYEVVG